MKVEICYRCGTQMKVWTRTDRIGLYHTETLWCYKCPKCGYYYEKG